MRGLFVCDFFGWVKETLPVSNASGVTEECFESVVHVLLDVAVEEGEAGLVGGEVDDGAAEVGDYYGVLDDAGGFLSVNFGEFP